MSNKIPEQVYEIRDRILSCVEADRIYLFGSYAYGTPNEESDFDFYVVLPDGFPMERLDVITKIRHNLCNNMNDYVPVDILTNYKKDFDERSQLPTLERKIVREGVIVYDTNRISERMV
jgi:predicted nucleotidyltransferase